MTVERSAYLWDGTEPGWVLLRMGDGFLPYSRVSRRALLIEDEEELGAVLSRLE